MALEPDTLGGDCECAEGAPAWMATFSDLATLLLTFFVLLLSFAEMDKVEFKAMLGSVKEAFGVRVLNPGHLEGLTSTPVELTPSEDIPWTPLNARQLSAMQAIQRFIRQRNMESDMEVGVNEKGVVVRLKDRLVFPPGEAQLKDAAGPVLEQIREMIGVFPSGLSIEGHTDDRPIRNRRYRSNWDLSTARAIAVLQSLQGYGELDLSKLSVVGHADLQPVAPNDTEENRARNRRVEFVFAVPGLDKSQADKLKITKALGDLTHLPVLDSGADAPGKPGSEASGSEEGAPAGSPADGVGPVIDLGM